jgi:NAD(P)-dependent dehydrogenase (short-subunit alcohol dehydrogenase family)
MDMLLEYKNAVIYGAGGAIGSAVTRAFAREGAMDVVWEGSQVTKDWLKKTAVFAHSSLRGRLGCQVTHAENASCIGYGGTL